MLLLKFAPRRGAMPKWPGKGAGSYPYIGREFDAETRVNKATKEPAGVVAYDSRGKLTEDARRCIDDLCKRDGDLLPADKETAAMCGVPFVELEWDESGWLPKKPASKAAVAAKGGE